MVRQVEVIQNSGSIDTLELALASKLDDPQRTRPTTTRRPLPRERNALRGEQAVDRDRRRPSRDSSARGQPVPDG
jgi:hypothetical protein